MKQIEMMKADIVEERPIEPDDFDWIVRNHQRRIYRTLLFLVRDSDAAEILTQECFLRAFKNRGSFRRESNLATWLLRIAINLAHDHNRNRRWAFWRRLTRTDRIDLMRVPDTQDSPEQVLIETELVTAIQSAVETLSERQKIVFLMRFTEDMPLEEIAVSLDSELGTVKTHLYRAIEAVRKECMRRMI
jgi:RNA polymerase sigma-70 factor, ECF subfamily